MTITRRTFVGGIAGLAGLTAAQRSAFAALTMPSSPLTLSVVDASGRSDRVTVFVE